jgi:glyoxylase-like metal-dependent hydrolase (beta-lactamase superfamily II)
VGRAVIDGRSSVRQAPRWAVTALLLAAPAVGVARSGAASARASQPAAAAEVYAVRYGAVRDFPAAALVAGADTARRLDIAFMVWVIKLPGGRTALVDAGFYRQKFLDQWKPDDYRRPSEAIGAVGVKPEDVTDVIVTHVHWDHLDGADLFPNARVWIQRDEYEHHVDSAGRPRDPAIDSADAAMLRRLRDSGRVTLVDGDGRELFPGVTAYTGGRHTHASQYVGVRTARGVVVVASDNAYLYENLERHRPIAQTLDSAANLRAQARMAQLAATPRLIVPGHDPAVFQRFPEPGRGVARIE